MSTGRLRPTVGEPRASVEQRAEALVERALMAPVFVDVVIPRTTVKGRMRLVTRNERFEAHAETRRLLQEAGFAVDASAITALGCHEQWQFELAARILAAAVREPGNTERALASIEDWRECDDDQLNTLFLRYQDLEHANDPISAELTEAEVAAMFDAAKKKDAVLLTSFGSSKLASFAITSVSLPASSTTPAS